MRFIATVWIIFAILGGCAVGALLSKCSPNTDKYPPNYEDIRRGPDEDRKEM